jgi:hypothetical protein
MNFSYPFDDVAIKQKVPTIPLIAVIETVGLALQTPE